MNVYEAATTRRSIRRFLDKPVPDAALERCVDAARLAPSGRNDQVCEYIAINDSTILPGVYEHIGGSIKLPPEKGGPRPANTPHAYIIVLINKDWGKNANRRRVTYYDVGLAAENIILVAWDQGLGACPVLMYDESSLKPILDIPESRDIALVIALGYPEEHPVADAATDKTAIWVDENLVRHVPKRQLGDVLYRNKFGG